MANSHSDTDLMYRMARSLGIDLRKRQRQGTLDQDTLARLERRCMVCSSPKDCAQKLDRQARGFSLPQGQWPPDYCINRKFLEFLSKLEQKPGQHQP